MACAHRGQMRLASNDTLDSTFRVNDPESVVSGLLTETHTDTSTTCQRVVPNKITRWRVVLESDHMQLTHWLQQFVSRAHSSHRRVRRTARRRERELAHGQR